jgi:hypothetical protein
MGGSKVDAHEQLVIESEISFAVVGKGENFILVRLDSEGAPLDEAAIENARERDFAYCGVLGVKDGNVGVQFAPDNPTALYTMMFAGLAFAHEVADRLRPQPKGDAVEWLKALFAMKDSRNTGREN